VARNARTAGSPASILDHVRRSSTPIVVSLAVSTAIIGVAVAIKLCEGVPFRKLTGDPAELTHTPVYYGLLSNLGVVEWAATAAIGLFVAIFAPKCEGEKGMRRYLLACGLLSTLLGFDDLFLVHERLIRYVLDVPEILMYLAYAAAAAAVMAWFRAEVMRTDLALLALTAIALGLAACADEFMPPMRGGCLFEDGPKFVGTTCWLTYVLRTSTHTLARQRPFPDAPTTTATV